MTLRGWWLGSLVLLAACPGGVDIDTTTATSTSTTGSTTSVESDGPTVTATDDATTTMPTTGEVTDSSGGPDCGLPPVDEKIVDWLYISGTGFGPGANHVAVGSSRQLSLSWIDDGFPTPVEACVEWSVDGPEGTTIDQDGLLSIGDMANEGNTILVVADLENGRRLIMVELVVYVPIDSPILGYWTEVEQLPCGGGAAFVPDPLIGELVLDDSGEFSVTWSPFEVYIDYWGTFTHDPATGALSMTVEGGNYVPPDVDGEGLATVVGGQLQLEDIWLGSPQEPMTPVACGHVFQ